jgi:hypothetical protein
MRENLSSPDSSMRVKPNVNFVRSHARRPEKNAGVRGPCGRKHVFFLIFFGSFLDQAEKEQRITRRWNGVN